MAIKRYREMIVWQKSMDLVVEIYRLLKFLPKEENFALAMQMRRSAVSIPSNIAEGQSRKSIKDFAHFLSIARGSAAELETQCYICERLNYLSKEQMQLSMDLLDEIGRILTTLISKFSQY